MFDFLDFPQEAFKTKREEPLAYLKMVLMTKKTKVIRLDSNHFLLPPGKVKGTYKQYKNPFIRHFNDQ